MGRSRLLLTGTVAAAVLAGCGGTSSLPQNGKIAAAHDGRMYVMNSDGSGLRKVVRGDVGPAFWTPDAKWLAYNTYHPITDERASYERLDLWLMRPDGSGRRLVARNAPLGTFSPNGKTMAFMNDSCLAGGPPGCETSAENATEVYTIGLDGRDRRRLTRNGSYDGDPAWSPDGKRIVFATDRGIRIMDRDGGNVRIVTSGYWDAWPQWSPRGEEILISTLRGWAMVSPHGGKIRYLKRGPRGPEWGATWSPDGTRIVYLSKRARRWTAEDRLQIWVMKRDGTGRHPITRTFGWSVPSWAPAP